MPGQFQVASYEQLTWQAAELQMFIGTESLTAAAE